MSTSTSRDPVTIKRYQNRKLYNTQESCYVTLEEIARLVQGGQDVVVIDNKTKKNITAATLAQILFENEKKDNSLIPLPTLKQIIRTQGASMTATDNDWWWSDFTTPERDMTNILFNGTEDQVTTMLADTDNATRAANALQKMHGNLQRLSTRVERLLTRTRTQAATTSPTQPVMQ